MAYRIEQAFGKYILKGKAGNSTILPKNFQTGTGVDIDKNYIKDADGKIYEIQEERNNIALKLVNEACSEQSEYEETTDKHRTNKKKDIGEKTILGGDLNEKEKRHEEKYNPSIDLHHCQTNFRYANHKADTAAAASDAFEEREYFVDDGPISNTNNPDSEDHEDNGQTDVRYDHHKADTGAADTASDTFEDREYVVDDDTISNINKQDSDGNGKIWSTASSDEATGSTPVYTMTKRKPTSKLPQGIPKDTDQQTLAPQPRQRKSYEGPDVPVKKIGINVVSGSLEQQKIFKTVETEKTSRSTKDDQLHGYDSGTTAAAQIPEAGSVSSNTEGVNQGAIGGVGTREQRDDVGEVCDLMNKHSLEDSDDNNDKDRTKNQKTAHIPDTSSFPKHTFELQSPLTGDLVQFFLSDLIRKYEKKDIYFCYRENYIKFQCPKPEITLALESEFKSAMNILKQNINSDSLDVNNVTEEDIENNKHMFDKQSVFIVNDKERKQLIFHGTNWNDIQTVKQQFKMKLFPDTIPKTRNRNFGSQQNQAEGLETNLSLGMGHEKNSVQGQGARPKTKNPNNPLQSAKLVFKIRSVEVKVYKSNILDLPVRCIVNAANRSLQHDGGVARVIADAAGKKYKQESRSYIKAHGKLELGQACSTSAGQLSYAHVIHTVGPCWIYYKPHALADVKSCERDLRMAIKSSLRCAEKLKHTSIAFSAVSAGQFGCPLELCAVQYGRAVLENIQESSSPVKKIHFVDLNPDTVTEIGKVFTVIEDTGNLPESYKTEKFVKPTAATIRETTPDAGHHESEGEDCVICMGTIDNPKVLPCGHKFCTDCINTQFDYKAACPTCGLSVEKIQIRETTPDAGHHESEGEDCVICMGTIDNPKVLPCGHKFCTDCINTQFDYKAACPTCGAVCGKITGDQPKSSMSVYTNSHASCSGYENYGRIEITYSLPSGQQQSCHPSPGTYYRGIKRTAFLSDNRRGRQILAMLEIAFKRKLVFTIGNSRTTGQQGVITWNGIHHKTNPKPHTPYVSGYHYLILMSIGASATEDLQLITSYRGLGAKLVFGYPDPTYLDRVVDDLKAKGVTEADISSSGSGLHSTRL